MSSNTAKIQVNFKTGAGHNASLINLYADNEMELDFLLDELNSRVGSIVAIEQAFQGVVGAGVPAAVGATTGGSVTPPQVVSPSTPAPAHGGPDVVTDRYGNQWTYGLADAPLLPDGRGSYARKDWTSQQGKRLKAWVDPAKGPKSFPAGAAEAEIVWIR